MVKLRGLVTDAESYAAEINKYKQKMREAQSTGSDLQYKLEQTERELVIMKAKVTSMEQEADKQLTDWEFKLVAQQTKEANTLKEKMAQNDKVRATFQEQLKGETLDLQNKLSAKDSLLEAKEKLLKLVTSKSQSLQKKEETLKQQVKDAQEVLAEMAAKHAAELASLKEQLDKVRDELKCAEEEVIRCRDAHSSVENLQNKLEKAERELIASKAKVASMEQYTVKLVDESKLNARQTKNADDCVEDKLSSFEQQLDESKKAYLNLQEQVKAETLHSQKELSVTHALLEAKEKKLKLVTAKCEALEKNEAALKQELKEAQEAVAIAAAKHAANMVSLKEEMDEVKDELKCAEEEVSRSRTRIKEVSVPKWDGMVVNRFVWLAGVCAHPVA